CRSLVALALLAFPTRRFPIWIDEHGVWHGFRIRIARILADPEDDDLLRYADLRRRQARAVERSHRVMHIDEQRTQLGRVERLDRLCDLQKPRIAHLENRSDSHWSCV